MKSQTAWVRHGLLDALAQGLCAGTLPPCCGPERDAWTSDDPAERAEAARSCIGCPSSTFIACGAAARVGRESFGVWAGVDRTVDEGGGVKADRPPQA